MKNYAEILENIQFELQELAAINISLREENDALRKQLGMMPSNDNNDELSLEDVFHGFSLRDDTAGNKIHAFNCLWRAGYENIGDLRNKSILDLLKIPKAGPSTCAIWIVLLEHYDIHIKLLDLDFINGSDEYKKVKKIYDESLPKIRESIVFNK